MNERTGNDGEREVDVAELVDVLDPLLVRAELVAREANLLDAALLELGREARSLGELGRADRSEVAARMGGGERESEMRPSRGSELTPAAGQTRQVFPPCRNVSDARTWEKRMTQESPIKS